MIEAVPGGLVSVEAVSVRQSAFQPPVLTSYRSAEPKTGPNRIIVVGMWCGVRLSALNAPWWSWCDLFAFQMIDVEVTASNF